MNTPPLVSCIIIFLNEERFLEAAIESVLAQTYSSWELLLVDDGSSDGSSAIAQQYAQQHPEKIRYLDHPYHQNLGMSAARNLGLSESQGDYVAFLDGDDIWRSDKLECQVALLLAHPQVSFVFGPLLSWYSWSNHDSTVEREPGNNPIPADHLYGVGPTGTHPYRNQIVPPPKLLTLQLQNEEFIPSGALVTREALMRVGGCENIFRGNYEDAVLWTKICLKYTAYISEECWYYYRIHPNSWCRTEEKLGNTTKTQKKYLDWVEQYLKEQKVVSIETWKALQTAKRNCYIVLFKENAKILGRRILPRLIYTWLSTQWKIFKIELLGNKAV